MSDDRNKNADAIIFYIVTSLYWFGLYTYGSVLSNHAAGMGANAAMIGLISGSYGFAQMILRLPIGIFSDSIKNRKRFIGAGIFFACISSIGLGLSSTPGQLLLFRSIAGIAASMFVVFPGYITEMHKDADNHSVMGILSAVNRTGRMAAIFIGGLAVQFFGGKWAFLTGGIVAGAAIFIWFFLPADRYHADHQKHSVKELLHIIRDKDLYVSAGLTAMFQFAVFATTFTFTPILAKNIGMSDVSIGLLTSLYTLTGIISSLLSGTVMKRLLGPKKTVTVAFFGSGLLFVIMPFVRSAALLYILQISVGMFMGMILPLLMGQCLKNIPKEKKGTAMGFYQAVYGIGMVAGPYIVGLITRYSNLSIGYIMVLVICMIAAMLTYLYGRGDRRDGLEKY